MSDDLKDFLEKNPPVKYSSSGGFKGDVAQVKFEFGYAAFIAGAFGFFPIVPPFVTEEKSRQKCREHIAVSGKDGEPSPFFQITTYPPYLHNTRQNDWEYPERRVGMAAGYVGTEENPTDYGVFSEQFLAEDSVLNNLENKKVWAHYVQFPYPSYDKEDKSTWNRFNTQTYKNKSGEEVTSPKFMIKVLQVFANEQEARAWYAEQMNAVSISGDGNTITRAEALAQLTVPDGIDQDWGNWQAMSELVFRDAMKDIANELVTRSAEEYYDEFSKDYVGGTDHPITVEWLTKVKEIAIKYPEF